MSVALRFSIWVEGARPKTLIAALSPVLIGSEIAFVSGSFCLSIFLITLLSALFIQIGTNFANDYLDYLKGRDTSDRHGPRRLAQSGLLSVPLLKRATLLSFTGAGLGGVYLTFVGGFPFAFLTLISMGCGFLYTATRYSLSSLGIADLFVFFFFGPIATGGTAYLQLQTISLPAILAGISPGLLSTALLTANNLRDRETDQKAGKKTIPVRFGRRVGQGEYFFCLVGAALAPFFLVLVTKAHYASLTTAAFLLFAFSPMKMALSKKSSSFIPLLPQTAKLLTLYTLFFLLTWPLSP